MSGLLRHSSLAYLKVRIAPRSSNFGHIRYAQLTPVRILLSQPLMDNSLLQELKTALAQERDKLVAELKSFAKPDAKMSGNWDSTMPQFETGEYGSHASLEEEADEVEEYETRLATEHSLESRLLEINRAIERIKKEAYGKCAKCGKEISLERLRANPAAEFCIEHAP